MRRISNLLKPKKKIKIVSSLFILLLFLTLGFIFDVFPFNVYKTDNSLYQQSQNIVNSDEMKIHFIDVGQGDSIFIELPNKETMLIDAGEENKGTIVKNYISNLGYTTINYLIGTHPHTDHIGGLSYIINNFNIEKIYMPRVLSTTKTYEDLLMTIKNKGLSVTVAKAGVNIIRDNDLSINVIAPNSDSYSDLNNYSAAIKLVYKNKKFLFMGDAEIQSENEITTNLSADLIKVGHHGSDSSSSIDFVNKVKPKYAIIMVGNNNQYHHPYQSIVDRWTNIGATVYRTDLCGTIVATTNGDTLNVSTSK